MPRFAVMCIAVRRILEPAAGVTDLSVDYAGHVSKNFLDTSEATAREHGHLGPIPIRDHRSVLPILFNRHGSNYRSDLKAARISPTNKSVCSQAAKWVPFGKLL